MMIPSRQVAHHFGIDGFPLTERPWANSVNHFVGQILLQLQPQEWNAHFTCFIRRSGYEVPDSLNQVPVDWMQPSGRNFTWRHIALPLAAKRARVDVMWFPFNIIPFWTRTRSVVTIHDLSFVALPHLFDWRAKLYLGVMLRRSLAQASRIATISQFTADELIRLFGVKANHITVIHHGFNDRPVLSDERAAKEFMTRYGVDESFFLFLGGDNPRKNPDLLLTLLAQSPANVPGRAQFVITGNVSLISRLLQRYGLHERIGTQVILPGMLSESELDMLYRKARALLYLSHYEGFGLPILEAFARNCPVIALRSSSLPEVAGDAALFVDNGNVSQLEDAIAEMANDNVRDQFVRAGRQQGLRFSWKEAAQRLYLTLVEAQLD
jgi:glycosyltransferase involved in cell wall biosynthesis